MELDIKRNCAGVAWNAFRNLFISALFVVLIIIVPHTAHARQNAKGLVAYIQDGDLWVKELPAGQSKQLVTNGNIRSPRWSPSGQWLAYLEGDQLHVIQRSGAGAKSLGRDNLVSRFAWSPISDTLAYRLRSGGLWTFSGSNWVEREIASNTAASSGTGVLGFFAWSPDGKWIAYGRQKDLTYLNLLKIPVSGGEPTEINAGGLSKKGIVIPAQWSGDGRFLLVWQSDMLSSSTLSDGAPFYAVPVAGGKPVMLADTVLIYPDFIAAQPRGGEQVAVITGGCRNAWTYKTLRIFLPTTGQGGTLTSPDQAASSPAWSPDGQHIAFSGMPDRQDLSGGEKARLGLMHRRIWMVTADGDSQLRRITKDTSYREEYPLWSDDGSCILFVRMNDHNQTSLWLLQLGEDSPRMVADELGPLPKGTSWFGYYGHVDWGCLFDWWSGAT